MFRRIADELKSSYNSTSDDVSQTFYNRVLSESVLYKRVSGYFSSKALAQYADGLDKLFDKHGEARFIISTQISEEDMSDIKTGYEVRSDGESLTEDDKKCLGNLAFMIGNGSVSIKFGLSSTGIFHSKWGLFEDKINDGDVVYFMGSNNETEQALERNYEDFDVDVSWDTSPNVRQRIAKKENVFDDLWNDRDEHVRVVDANQVVSNMLSRYNEGQIQHLPEPTDDALVLTIDPDNPDGYMFYDNTDNQLLKKNRLVRSISSYVNPDKGIPFIKAGMDYRRLERMIGKVRRIAKHNKDRFIVSSEVKDYISKNKYTIEEFETAGLTLKDSDQRWTDDYRKFSQVVSHEVERPLKELQMKSAFYMYTQKRAANFSVPGSGKTAMLLGVFAYLNYSQNKKVDRILVISPINAFMSWKDEFKNVFGRKKELHVISVHDEGVTPNSLRMNWYQNNLILVNYESLQQYGDAIAKALKNDGGHTLLVFDEVHRIKGVQSKRAVEALKIAEQSNYKYVLTGTPIPNTYLDIWNFLHILYNAEYDSYFGFEKRELKNVDTQEAEQINEKLQPFFWRTSKEDLGVPKANPDKIYEAAASPEQMQLADIIYTTESNPLAIMIRMLQLSTNPELLSQKLSFADFGFADFDDGNQEGYDQISAGMTNKLKKETHDELASKVKDIDLTKVEAPKFSKGISLVKSLVEQNKRVVVWGLFVNTLDKITAALNDAGINAKVIYGATPKEERDVIITDFKQENSEIQVLVSNPNTLGESVSLHGVVHDAVYFEYNYNLTFMLQSRDRIHRLGLPKGAQTNYHYLMTMSDLDNHNFIDKKVYEKLQDKEVRMKQAIDEGILTPEFSDDEFDEMKSIVRSEL